MQYAIRVCAAVTLVSAMALALAVAAFPRRAAGQGPDGDLLGALGAKLQPAETAKSDSELRKLLKERYNTNVDEVRALLSLYASGRVGQDQVADAVQRLARSGVALAETPAERIKHLELAWETAKAVEAAVRIKYESAVEPMQALFRAKGLRLDAEIELLRAREAAKAAGAPK